MAFIDGEYGENFMTVLGYPQFGNFLNDVDPNLTTRSSNQIWEEKQPTVNRYVMQKLNKLEQEIKELKKELKKSKGL